MFDDCMNVFIVTIIFVVLFYVVVIDFNSFKTTIIPNAATACTVEFSYNNVMEEYFVLL